MAEYSRRDFLRWTGVAGAAALGGWPSRAFGQLGTGGQTIPLAMFGLRMAAGQSQILSGNLTNVYSFTAPFKKGVPGVVTDNGTYLGPTIHLKKDQVVRASITNDLDQNTVLHWHGLHLPEEVDGLPTQIIGPNTTVNKTFRVVNRAGTYWYHPHPHMSTATQVYKGLAGFIIVSDPQEQVLNLPKGDYDVAWMIQDRRFDANNQFAYFNGGMMGNLGNRILVNGQADFIYSGATRIYRVRLLNGSNSRIYKLAWDTGIPMILIGTDGGLISAPVTKPYIMLAPGERVELWADFSHLSVGTTVTLKSLAFSGVGQASGQTPINGAALDIMKVRIDRSETETRSLPMSLTPITWENPDQAINKNSPRHFPIVFDNTYGWTLNGLTYVPNEVTPNETVKLNDLEIWEFSHVLYAMSLSAHPIHIHGAQFQVLSRTIDAARSDAYATVKYGFTDEGWKDTFLVMPGETVQVLKRFTRYTGMSLFHCHNLEHEDMGMMRHYRVDP